MLVIWQDGGTIGRGKEGAGKTVKGKMRVL